MHLQVRVAPEFLHADECLPVIARGALLGAAGMKQQKRYTLEIVE